MAQRHVQVVTLPLPSTVGIDVGAPSKGYHAVALSGTAVAAKYHSCSPAEMADWCIQQNPAVVAIDAPCRWRRSGGPPRAAELALAKDRISCFSTPTEEKARGHAFYTWMFAGHALYAALADHYPIYTGDQSSETSGLSTFNRHLSTRVAVESYPHAISCALAGGHVSAKQKFANRTALLRQAGIDPSPLQNIDEVDAALCALAAQHFAAGTFKAYGDAIGGYIIVPRDPLPGPFDFKNEAPSTRRQNGDRAALAQILSLLPTLTPAERLQLASSLDDIGSRDCPT